MTKTTPAYEPPTLVFADPEAQARYAERYPAVVKMASEVESQRCVIVALTAADVATMYLDAKYYNG